MAITARIYVQGHRVAEVELKPIGEGEPWVRQVRPGDDVLLLMFPDDSSTPLHITGKAEAT